MSVEAYIKQHLKQAVVRKQSVGTGLFLADKVLLANNQTVFVKHQSRKNQQLILEGQELNLLGKIIHAPKVLASDEHCLILEWIEVKHNPNLQSQMGIELAQLHQNTQPFFGFDFDNKIGQTPQPNAVGEKIDNWAQFYWQYRLQYQINLAKDNQLISEEEYQQLLSIKTLLPKLLDYDIKPTLLHGDLWSGNVLSGEDNPYFIDSASYYGHREIDFALTFMFGGFSSEFYESYNKTYPLSKSFNDRKPLYMLYHYLNHLNIFGSGYHQHVMRCYNALR
ncbi:MAG: fructosamine kinase family protein [Proteobacteria bacterium]|nr:fructosamine kinase family protein [Pseudomonadota bacterium]